MGSLSGWWRWMLPAGQDVRVVDAQGALQGEDVLPGFELPLRELLVAPAE
ncbi:MAG: hypothetical protein LC114_20770 [Bryobacterales bacterium]|nr:hypothetical protein [Bryobacterales bacterium]